MFWIQFLSHILLFQLFLAIRQHVLDRISVPNSVVPTFVAIHHPSPVVSIIAQVSVPVMFFTLLSLIIDWQLAHRPTT